MSEYYQELGGTRNGFFTRNDFVKVDDELTENTFKFIKSRNNTDVYRSVYSYSSLELNDCLLSAPLYIDLDMDSITEESQYDKLQRDLLMAYSYLVNILKVPKDSISLFFSGHKGYHIIIPQGVFGIEPSKSLNEQYKKIAFDIRKNTLHDTVDIKIYDRRRLLRLVNSKHGKTGLYKVPITIEEAGSKDYESLKKYASCPKPQKKVSDAISYEAKKAFEKIANKEDEKSRRPISTNKCAVYETNKLLPCVVSILTNGVSKGMRNETAVATASALMQTGKTKEQVLDIMTDWNEANDPPMNSGDINTTVNSAYKMLQGNRGYGCNTFKTLGLCTGDCNLRGGK